MLTVFLVDDDKVIRKGLTSMITRAGDAYEILGECDNGRDAVARILQLHPDVVITDVKMPVMDGIELIQHIRKEGSQAKVIVLSGFDDYSFVRGAMKLGAVDYLLKPIENDALLELLQKIGREIDQKAQADTQESWQAIADRNSDIVQQERLLLQLVSGGETLTAAHMEELAQCEMEQGDHFCISVIEVSEDWQENKAAPENDLSFVLDLLKYELYVLASQKAPNYHTVSAVYKQRLLTLWWSCNNGEAAVIPWIEQVMLSLASSNQLSASHRLTVGISTTDAVLTATKKLYLQAKAAVQSEFYTSTGMVAKYVPESTKFRVLRQAEITDKVSELYAAMEVSHVNRIKRTLDEIFTFFVAEHIAPEQVKQVCAEIFNGISQYSKEFESLLACKAVERKRISDAIFATGSLEQLSACVAQSVKDVLIWVNDERNKRSKKTIQVIKDYILQHFSEAIDLKTVAEQIGLSPNYMSNLFKAQTGQNFIEFLTVARIEKAKELLGDPMYKIYEIGSLVGYSEAVSFNRAFKRIVGLSPSEYRSIVK